MHEASELVPAERYLIIFILVVVVAYGLYVRFSALAKPGRKSRLSKLNKVYPDKLNNATQLSPYYSENQRENPETKDYSKYLEGQFRYYDNLNEADKKKFIERVKVFVESKNFSGRSGLVVTDQIKVLLAAAAIQLTFGLENFTFDYFENIIIYPDVYVSPVTGKKHKGEAHPLGAIVISWKEFEKGYGIPDDRLNLGLHEMAHALELENRLGVTEDEEFASRYEKFKRLTDSEFKRLQNNEDSFLRSYAGTNREEFFAVCVEHFFEAGEEFKKELPKVYEGLSELLGQEP